MQDIYISYLRTAVSCNITDQAQGESNTANWSGSTFCYDRNFVIGEATRNQGWLTAMGYALKVFSVFFLGIVADAVGRRVTMIVGSVGMCIAFGLLALNSFIDGGASIVLITVSSVIQGLTNPATGGVSPFVTAMIADLSTEKDRGFAMTSYAAVRTMFSLVAFGVGYYILSLEFTDYSLVWAGFGGVAALSVILFIFVVEETLGHQPYLQLSTADAAETSGHEDSARATTSIQRPTTGAGRRLGMNNKTGTSVQPVAQALRKNLCAGCCIVVRSPFLRLYIVSCVLMYCAFGGTFFIAASYLLAQMRWTQANASLALFLQSVATIVGYIVNYSVVGSVRGESYTTFGIGVSGAIVGNLVVGLLSPSHVAGFWVGFMIIGLAYGFALPALPTIASMHADSEEQAQLQSTFTVATMIGLIVASELHTNIYDENAVGVVAGTPFFASSGLLAMSLVIHVLVRACSLHSVPALPVVGLCRVPAVAF